MFRVHYGASEDAVIVSIERCCSIFQLYMISEGMCIYNGPIDKLLLFLNAQNLHCPIHHNPADFRKYKTYVYINTENN